MGGRWGGCFLHCFLNWLNHTIILPVVAAACVGSLWWGPLQDWQPGGRSCEVLAGWHLLGQPRGRPSRGPQGQTEDAVDAVVQGLSCVQLWPHGLQHASLPCPSLSPRACSNSCPWSQWCHPTVLSSVTPFSSCPQSFSVSGSFPMSWLFTAGG